jgi:hypothetical protein
MPTGSASNIQGTIHLDRYLTNYSVQYVQDKNSFVSQRAATVIPVLKQTDAYVVYPRGYFWRDEAAPRPLGGRPVQVGYKVDSGLYSATEYALEHVVDDRQYANVDDPINLDENATRLLTGKMMIKQERIWAQKFFSTGKWTKEVTGVTSTPVEGVSFLHWTDAASDPIGMIDFYKDYMHSVTGFMPNTLVLGAAVKRTLRTHPDISDRIKYTQVGIADEDMLSSLFEIDNVMVARGIYNAANEGAADNLQYIVDTNGFWLGFIDPSPSLDSPTAIANFAWTGLIPGLTNAIGGVMERGRDDRAHSNWFQNRMAFDLAQVSPDLGVWFGNVNNV